MFTAQEILVGRADYPTDAHRRDSPQVPPARSRLRQPRRHADGAGTAVRQRRGPGLRRGHHLADDRPRLRHLGPHRRPHGALRRLRGEPRAHARACSQMHQRRRRTSTRSWCRPSCCRRRRQAWDDACELGAEVGVRNSQASVLAPTGTIGLMMDCDTTGIEPDLGLVKVKKLVGGGTMSIVNQTVPRALRRLGYDAGARSTRSSPTSTSTSRSSARHTSPPSTWRCSPARWATTPSTTRATCG